jgi:hypothetical protein
VHAAPSSAPPSPSAARADLSAAHGPDTRRAGLALRTDGWDESDGQGLRLALESTLGVVVSESKNEHGEELATVVVRRRSNGNVTIVFVRPGGREVERTLDLPADRAIATETIALAAGNLVRDEAAELVAALTPPPAAPEAAPPTPEVVLSAPLPTTRRVSCTDAEPIFFGADFAPYAGTSSKYPDRRRTLSLNFVGGYARGLRGFELGVGANIESAFMCGVQVAAGANVVLGDVRGVQLAVGDVALGNLEGVQVGVANFAKGNIEGVQVGVASVGGGALEGAQVSVVNLLNGSVLGNQSGVVNLASANISGAQVGVVNVAGGGVDGVQVGTTNIANGEVHGTQIGVVNYADVSDYPVGVVSVVRHGRTSVDGWATEAGIGMVGARHGGRVIHNVYGVGYRAGTTDGWALALGLGARAEIAPKFHVDFETIAYWIQRGKPFDQDAQIGSLGASFGYALTPVFGLFAAPTLNVLVTPDKELAGIAPGWSTTLVDDGSITIKAWPGATLGLRAAL